MVSCNIYVLLPAAAIGLGSSRPLVPSAEAASSSRASSRGQWRAIGGTGRRMSSSLCTNRARQNASRRAHRRLFFLFWGGRGSLDTQATPATSQATANPDPGHSPHLSGGRTGRTRSATPPSGPRPSRHAPAPPVGQPDPATPSGATRASDPSTILLPGEAKLDPAKLLLYALAARAFGIPASTALPQAAKFSDLSEPCRHTDAAGGLPRSAPPAQQPTVRIIFKQLVRRWGR